LPLLNIGDGRTPIELARVFGRTDRSSAWVAQAEMDGGQAVGRQGGPDEY